MVYKFLRYVELKNAKQTNQKYDKMLREILQIIEKK